MTELNMFLQQQSPLWMFSCQHLLRLRFIFPPTDMEPILCLSFPTCPQLSPVSFLPSQAPDPL